MRRNGVTPGRTEVTAVRRGRFGATRRPEVTRRRHARIGRTTARRGERVVVVVTGRPGEETEALVIIAAQILLIVLNNLTPAVLATL